MVFEKHKIVILNIWVYILHYNKILYNTYIKLLLDSTSQISNEFAKYKTEIFIRLVIIINKLRILIGIFVFQRAIIILYSNILYKLDLPHIGCIEIIYKVQSY